MFKSKSRSRKTRPANIDWIIADIRANLARALLALTGGPRSSPTRGQGPAVVLGNGARTSIEIAPQPTPKRPWSYAARAARLNNHADLGCFGPAPFARLRRYLQQRTRLLQGPPAWTWAACSREALLYKFAVRRCLASSHFKFMKDPSAQCRSALDNSTETHEPVARQEQSITDPALAQAQPWAQCAGSSFSPKRKSRRWRRVVCPLRCLGRWSSLAAGLRRVSKGRTRGWCKNNDASARVIPGARPVASQSARACDMQKNARNQQFQSMPRTSRVYASPRDAASRRPRAAPSRGAGLRAIPEARPTSRKKGRGG